MNKIRFLNTLIPLSILLILILSGCGPFQPGYYLTPVNFPDGNNSENQQIVFITSTPEPTPRPIQTATPDMSASSAVPDWTPSPPPTNTPCSETTGSIRMDSFVSQLTGSVFHFRIYLPPCYDTMPHRYPYLLMLHGLGTGMDDSQWDRMGIAQAADGGYLEGTLPPMAIVMPNGNDADHASYRGPSPYPDLIVEELMPYLETTYCLSGNPDLHAVGGLSRGGFWAYYVALTSPELFGKVGGHSPYFYAPGSPYEKNPDSILDTAPGIEHLAMYLDHGPADYPEVIAGVRDYSNRLAARGIFPVLVINESGGHTEDYWSAHTGDYLSFYGADWPLQPSGLQECAVDSP